MTTIPRSVQTETTVESSHLFAAVLCTLVSTLFAAFFTDCLHWFIFPVTCCGFIMAIDAIDWIRGRMDVFDAAGLLGLFGLHFFFLAPLIHVSQDFWIEDWSPVVDTPPSDWRPWVGIMALINLIGLLLYHRLSRVAGCESKGHGERQVWRLNAERFVIVFPALLLLCILVQFLVLTRFGGLSGYVTAYEDEGFEAFSGWGRIFLLSESTPMIAFIAFSLLGRTSPVARSRPVLVIALLGFLALTMLFGGLRGARGYTVWSLFWAVGIVHLYLRRIPRQVVFAGIALLVVFMYGYGFYKWGGKDAVRSILDPRARSDWVEESNFGMMRTILFDMGRCDIQAYLLYRLIAVGDYDYAIGRSYIGAAAVFVPESIWPSRPPTKVKEGTEIQYGKGAFIPGHVQSLWCYGLGGETMLNFSPLAIPVAYAMLGVLVRHARRFAGQLDRDDVRRLYVPFAVIVCFYLLVWDSDNLIVLLVKLGSIPIFAILLCSHRLQRNDRPPRFATMRRANVP